MDTEHDDTPSLPPRLDACVNDESTCAQSSPRRSRQSHSQRRTTREQRRAAANRRLIAGPVITTESTVLRSPRTPLTDITPGSEPYDVWNETGSVVIPDRVSQTADVRKLSCVKMRADDAPDYAPTIPPDKIICRKNFPPSGPNDFCFICDPYPRNMTPISLRKRAELEEYLITNRMKLKWVDLAKNAAHRFEMEIRRPANEKRRDGMQPVPRWTAGSIYAHLDGHDRSSAGNVALYNHRVQTIADHLYNHGIFRVQVDSDDRQDPNNIVVDSAALKDFYATVIMLLKLNDQAQRYDERRISSAVRTVHTNQRVDLINNDPISSSRTREDQGIAMDIDRLLEEEDGFG